MKTTPSASAETLTRRWHLVDATDVPLGRLASKVATLLRGKHRADYTPHVDTGDFVVVINAKAVKLTGNKLNQKYYHRHSGYPGGLRSELYAHLMERSPELVIQKAVRGMLPKNSLGRAINKKLKVYADAEHPHSAQQPKALELN